MLYQEELVGIRLAEDHPGRGLLFDVWVGTWCHKSHDWLFPNVADSTDLQKCIDWNCDVPSPATGAAGLGWWRPSATHGKILEIVDLDCP